MNASSIYDRQQLTGYASAPSVSPGGTIDLYIRAPGAYSIQIFRLGYYQGTGGRLLRTILMAGGQKQPGCRWLQAGTPDEYYSCDNWQDPVALVADASWVSGVYVALLTATSLGTTYQYHIPFVVRDDRRKADFLYQVPVATDEAYNSYFDQAAWQSPNSTITFDPRGPSDSLYAAGRVPGYPYETNVIYKVSFDRPYARFDETGLYRFSLPFIAWLEHAGYDVAYTTDIDTDEGREVLAHYKALLISGHSEYWSKNMYDAVLNARNHGVNLGFFGGDSIAWQARFEPDAAGVADRLIVCFRHANAMFPLPVSVNGAVLVQPPPEWVDPNTDPTLQTVRWRDPPIASPASSASAELAPTSLTNSIGAGRDEQTLVGVHHPTPFHGPNTINAWLNYPGGALAVHAPQPMTVQHSGNWVYSGTGVTDGDEIPGVYGQEADAFETKPNIPPPGSTYDRLDPPFQPPGARVGTFTILSSSAFINGGTPAGHATVNTTVYQACSGAWVFAAGSIMWGNALAPSLPVAGTSSPSRAAPLVTENYTNPLIQRITSNVLNVFDGTAAAPRSHPCLIPEPLAGPAAE
jgi:hypothetical protein